MKPVIAWSKDKKNIQVAYDEAVTYGYLVSSLLVTDEYASFHIHLDEDINEEFKKKWLNQNVHWLQVTIKRKVQ